MQPTTANENATVHTSESAELQKLHEVENLTNDLKRLLVQHEFTLDEEKLRHEVETLERWMESYRRGLSAAHKISETGTVWLTELRDRLKMAAGERLRLEDEGGNPPSQEQNKRTDALLEVIGHIDRTLPDIERIFHSAPEEEHA